MKGNDLKPRIGFFGRRNVGKSSLINLLTGQQVAIVSPTAGTTTDPVRKSMEIGGVGAVVLIDTAGLDDVGDLGRQRVEKSLSVLAEVDLAVLVYTPGGWGEVEEQVVRHCEEGGTPLLRVLSKDGEIDRDGLLKKIGRTLRGVAGERRGLLGDVVKGGDRVMLVTPIDSSAPEGRMILPQVQVLRELMDLHAVATFCQPEELEQHPALLGGYSLVITDSQVFERVAAVVPPDIRLTSFSIVLARGKGLFDEYLSGTRSIAHLQDGDRILLLESCTHNVTCDDIGRVKLPAALRKATGKDLQFDMVAGGDSLETKQMRDYALAIQCGGCVITPRQLRARLTPALQAGIPVSNYGLALAWCNGIFERATEVFKF